jgi:predicted enzyme related to lactoylglutathione lyase
MPAIVALLADDVFGGEREAAPDDVDKTTGRARRSGASVERVRAAGRANEPRHRRFGLYAVCVDDQGATFCLWQPTD